jgi:glycosyltransferase involved in cell wall biosynthesis
MRIYQLIRGLAARHTVTCLTFVAGHEEAGLAPLRSLCRVLTVRGPQPRSALRRAWTTISSPLPDMALRNYSDEYMSSLRALLRAERFDVVQVESIEMAQYGLGLEEPSGRRPFLVLDEFNAEYLLQKRTALNSLRSAVARQHPRAAVHHAIGGGYSLVQWRKLAHFERRTLRAYDRVLAVSDDDRQALLRLDPRLAIGVVPNGVDTAYFSRAALRRGATAFLQPETLVFSGTLDYRPNNDAVLWFVDQVLPLILQKRPSARLLVVGRRPPRALQSLASPSVTIVGEVPDARPFIAGAGVYVVPMRIGGGVRLKVLEALALEAAVVSTAMGAEGIAGLSDGEHCLLADEPDAFATAVVRLFDDQALRQRLGTLGRILAYTAYDWRVIVPRLEEVYREAMGGAG